MSRSLTFKNRGVAVGSFKNRGVGVGASVYRLQSPGWKLWIFLSYRGAIMFSFGVMLLISVILDKN
jgi:DNA modification methylase